MYDERYLSKMTFWMIAEELEGQQRAIDSYEANPIICRVAGTDFPNAVADVYAGNAQLYRRLAEIYDNWVIQLRSKGFIIED